MFEQEIHNDAPPVTRCGNEIVDIDGQSKSLFFPRWAKCGEGANCLMSMMSNPTD